VSEGNHLPAPDVSEGMTGNISKRLSGPLLVVALLGAFVVIGGGIEGVRAVVASPAAVKPASTSTLSSHSGHGAKPEHGGKSVTVAEAAQPAAACARKWPVGSPQSSLNPVARPGLSNALVPAGSSSMTVCRYAGLNQKVEEGTLERSLVVTGRSLSAFVTYADLKTWQVMRPGSVFSCPMSEGLVDVLLFVYPSGSPVTVTVDIGGCPLASNGTHTVWAGPIGSRLTQWVGQDGI